MLSQSGSMWRKSSRMASHLTTMGSLGRATSIESRAVERDRADGDEDGDEADGAGTAATLELSRHAYQLFALCMRTQKSA